MFPYMEDHMYNINEKKTVLHVDQDYSVCLSACLSLSVCLFVSLSSLRLCLSVCLSVSVSFSQYTEKNREK